DCKAINALFNFEHAEKCYNESRGISYDYDDYTSSVKEELKRNRESEYFSFDECSNAEMETASEIAAKKWCDYMEGK
ncbi:MAG: hypothetical protein NC393_13495, partial [Clostridium sp.]|nr:hypothetical protein [Clostridium sp.]